MARIINNLVCFFIGFYFCLFLGLKEGGASIAFAEDDFVSSRLSRWVVKVYSGLCGNEKDSFRGSGILFRKDNKFYVLTSEHVIIHSNNSICHIIYSPHLGEKKAKLILADWGMGLAVLQVIEVLEDNLDFISLDSLKRFVPPVRGTPVSVAGYPFSQKNLLVDSDGKVLVAQSSRHLIPLLPFMTELTESFGEYGMSGGGVFEANSLRFVGILSHQFIRKLPGQPSQVSEFNLSDVEVESSHLLIIPASFIYPWLEKVLKKEIVPSFLRDPLSQVELGQEVVRSSGLKFVFVKGKEKKDIEAYLFENDGVGIGGKGEAEDFKEKGGMVRVMLDLDAPQTDWKIKLRESWIEERIKFKLNRKAKILIPYFIKSNKDHSSIKVVRFSSISEFFYLLSQEDLKPVALVTYSPFLDHPRGYLIKKIKEKAQLIKSKIGNIKIEAKGEAAVQAKQLINQLRILSDLLSHNGWYRVDLSWVSNIQNSYEKGWQIFLNNNFDDSIEILRALIEIENNLKKLQA